MATKSANVMARVEPEIKEQAEEIISTLGMTTSGVINILYRQIILRKGLPFSVVIPGQPLARDEMSDEEFNQMMEKGYSDALLHKGAEAGAFFNNLRTGR